MTNRSRNPVTIVVATAAIGALLVISPAIGGPSLKNLVRKEVAKQIHKAAGPAGSAGVNGTNGTNGAPGTARAYATVVPHSVTPCAPQCSFSQSKGVTSVTKPGAGRYCISTPGIGSATSSAVASVDIALTNPPLGNASAFVHSTEANCSAESFEVVTFRLPSTTVRDAAGTGTTSVAGNSNAGAEDVGFSVIVP